MDNDVLESIFEDLSYFESLGLCHCLILLKYYLDVPSYVNILKNISKNPKMSRKKSDSIIFNQSKIESDDGDDSIEVSQSRNYETKLSPRN